MNLLQLMEKVEHYNEIAEVFSNKKVYVRFDGFHRFYNKQDAVNCIKENYLNRPEILIKEMLSGDDSGTFTIADDGFTYEVILFLHFWEDKRQ